MRSQAIILGFVAVVIALVYEFFLKDILFIAIGIGRIIQPIEDFPYSCRKIYGSENILESCEDVWLDDEGRTLYAACVDLKSRHEWSPGGDKLNASGRTPNGHFVALNIDSPGPDGNYGASRLQITGDYLGPAGSRAIDPNGFDVEILPNNRLRFWMTNVRPPVDAVSGEYLDATKVGANGTVESFELIRGGDTLKWTGTFGANGGVVHSPNKVAADLNGGFVVTNDHSTPIGLRRSLDPLLGGGSLAHCTRSNDCKIAVDGLSFPNGLVRGLDGLFYVPSSMTGRIGVYSLSSTSLTKIDEIEVGMPIDNLSIDANGDIFAAAFPDPLKLIKEVKYVTGLPLPSTVWQIRKVSSERDGEGKGKGRGSVNYRVWKVLEDSEGKLLPTGTTTAAHDAKTGRIFLGGVLSEHMTVCEPIPIAR
ncbi:Uncharacterized protein BP5553_01379 [Venustampulla echinocandica]|uniref:Calcium-dependent phosphotriesterase n=1 Tax=Venustampulla echinocandica TaxID=2656787 RepID=A0A370U0T6_9HELO|nr:Uncharacterized protein BP5553_01379 [Venustampulla echinocandica]RDL41400.1 Uncharacterized protein BP5553_01379 [Venustampulla echinocandica]